VTVANELPGASGQASAGGLTSEAGTTSEEITNYEISKTTQTEMTEAGSVKRLSVAVVVDGTYATDGNGNAAYQARSAEELVQITALVRSAIGFNEARGDQVQVANLPFAERPDALAEGSTGPGLFDFTRDDLMSAAEMLVTLLIALALVLFVMRPLLRRVLTPEQPLALPMSAEVGGPGLAAQERLPAELEPATEPQAAPSPVWMNHARQLGEAQAQTLKTVGSLVDENPKQAATIVRDWLGQAA
jgi:flagellar M-ring protein FliF